MKRLTRALKTPAPLAALLLAYLLVAGFYSVVTPLGEGPDEPDHYAYARFISQNWRMPISGEVREFFQPPLYYVFSALVIAPIEQRGFVIEANTDFSWTDPQSPRNLLLHSIAEDYPWNGWALAWHLVRLVSIVMGAVTVWATYQLAHVLMPHRPLLTFATAGFVAFLPGYLFISSIASNDNGVTMFSTLSLLALAGAASQPSELQGRRFVLIGFLVGLAVLTKTSALALLAVIPFAAFGAAAVSERTWQRIQLRAAWLSSVACASAAAVCGWWFWRNWLAAGDPLAWGLTMKVSDLRQGSVGLPELGWLARGIHRSFWGSFWGAPALWHPAIESAFLLGSIALVVCAGYAVVRMILRPVAREGWASASMLVAIAVSLLALVRWTMAVLGTDQARLLFPVLPAFVAMAFAGVWYLLRDRWRGPVLVAVAAFLAGLGILAPAFFLVPAYAAPVPLTQQALAALPATQACTFDGRLRLLGADVPPSVEAGGHVQAILYWEALEDIGTQYWMAMDLIGPAGQRVSAKDGCPSGGLFTTDHWTADRTLSAQHRLAVPLDAAPGFYTLRVRLHPFGSESTAAIGRCALAVSDGWVQLATVSVTR